MLNETPPATGQLTIVMEMTGMNQKRNESR
jgi:hypothetical protein